MLSTLELLRLTPEEGLRAIIQSSLKTGFDANHLRLGQPVGAGGTRTQIPLTIDKAAVPVEYWRYQGSVTFEYNRYDYATVFEPLNLELRVDMPATYDQLIGLLADKYGITFDAADYEPGIIRYGDGDLMHLTATPASLRWVGQVDLSVKPRIRALSDILTQTTLDQLAYNTENEIFVGPAEQRLLNNLNSLNADNLYRPIELSEVSFAEPVMLSEADAPENARVRLSIGRSDLYSGEIDLVYRRLYLPRLTNYLPVNIRSTAVLTTVDLAQLVATQAGFYLNPDDVIEDALPYAAPGEERTVTLYFKPTSLAYYGELTVNWTRA